jgi:ribulose-5-phosphate 4-epimerase/fuculose-1-phosphate aldolase
MSNTMTVTIDELLQANKILLHNNVLDAFGHVSVRHPADPARFLLSSALPPTLVSAADIIEFNLDSSPVETTNKSLYAERFIHGSIYQARPEVNAICHHHAESILPFCITLTKLKAVTQTGAPMGASVPVWDSRDEFGDTNLLISNSEQADSLAKTLDKAWLVLMRRHGACALGQSLRELVFRAIFSCQDAAIQLKARSLSEVDALSKGELELTAKISSVAINRCWDHWLAQLHASGAS